MDLGRFIIVYRTILQPPVTRSQIAMKHEIKDKTFKWHCLKRSYYDLYNILLSFAV